MVRSDESPTTVLRRLDESGDWAVLTVDGEQRPLRWVGPRDLEPDQVNLDGVGIHVTTVESRATLHDALDAMLTSSCGATVVVDDAGRYRGVVGIDRLMRVISEMRETERSRDRGVTEAPYASPAMATLAAPARPARSR